MAINYNGDIAVVLDMQHRTPGNLRAFVQATLRSIRTGKSSDVRFSELRNDEEARGGEARSPSDRRRPGSSTGNPCTR